MKRRSAPFLATGLALAAALSLSACGSDDGTSDAKETPIAGADSAKPSPTASATADADEQAAGRPRITFPSDAKNVFDDAKTGDAEKDAVLNDNAQRINSIDDAIFKGRTDTEALRFYSTGKALPSAASFIQGYLDDNYSWNGVTRYFNRKVTLDGDKKAAVVYCSDESASYLTDRKTKKRDTSPGDTASYVLYNTRLAKNSDGVWQTTDVISSRGARQCKP